MSYPKRYYTSVREIAVGDCVRMRRRDEHGNDLEPEAFSDAIVVALNTAIAPPPTCTAWRSDDGPVNESTIVTLFRPHMSMLRDERKVLGENWNVAAGTLVEHYHVLTTGHDGKKDNRRRLRVADVTKSSVGYHKCACRDCFGLYVGEPDEFCNECIEAGCEQDDTRDAECLRPETYGDCDEEDEPES